MIKTHKDSKIIQFHHSSETASDLLSKNHESGYIVLQVEPIPHDKYTMLAEIVKRSIWEVKQ